MTRSAGYTLIEVLIMLAVTAILAATVLETVRASAANGVRIEQAARQASQDYITLASVRRAVQASRADYNTSADTFDGDEQGFQALTSYPITPQRSGIGAYALRLENTPSGTSLVYVENDRSFTVQHWPGGQGRFSYLVEQTESRVGFTQRRDASRDREWVSSWPQQNTLRTIRTQSYFQPLPLAVRAEIEMANGTRRIMIFEMSITAPPRPRVQDLLGSLPQ
ncbi:type II secretion system protein [Oceanicaulis sp. MMSF_3324]|uniref:type II secretion system protein n=1 Tax=Oceanicaulis sp. MMSF_3324 TaxID=3046702 RepID=UPI00273EBB03|nr:prepilin-type N-terminal cleavage/methylation domain-containing protein [Oceanicaulis sp. MMSF_3324]